MTYELHRSREGTNTHPKDVWTPRGWFLTIEGTGYSGDRWRRRGDYSSTTIVHRPNAGKNRRGYYELVFDVNGRPVTHQYKTLEEAFDFYQIMTRLES